MRGPEPKGIQEPAFLPSSLSHLSRHHRHIVSFVWTLGAFVQTQTVYESYAAVKHGSP
jgi:hypothetical protein